MAGVAALPAHKQALPAQQRAVQAQREALQVQWPGMQVQRLWVQAQRQGAHTHRQGVLAQRQGVLVQQQGVHTHRHALRALEPGHHVQRQVVRAQWWVQCCLLQAAHRTTNQPTSMLPSRMVFMMLMPSGLTPPVMSRSSQTLLQRPPWLAPLLVSLRLRVFNQDHLSIAHLLNDSGMLL